MLVRVVRIVRVMLFASVLALAGCLASRAHLSTPTAAGLNTNNLVDIPAQVEAQNSFDLTDIYAAGEKLSRSKQPADNVPRKTILCLSGGGSFGAYSSGILCGWTECGDRPDFDVVTGVSTGALIAPFAFLGPRYDAQLKKLYTTSTSKDIYILRPVRGVFSEALADNGPLRQQMERCLTPEMMRDLAVEHSKGRRLYLGTTESQGRRFVVWDIGEIACRGRPEDRELIVLIMMGSSAIPGFFPPASIPVTVEGRPFVEKHVDGGVSFSLFMRPPYVAPEEVARGANKSTRGARLYVISAGKLYADPEVIRPWLLSVASANISTLTYAQTRGDLARLWTVCAMTGMKYHLASVPETAATPKSSTEFIPAEMQKLFDVGVQQICSGNAWRTTPPGIDPGEDPLIRASNELSIWRRSPPFQKTP
jgi:hypothetical protein